MKNHILKLFCTIAFLIFFAAGSYAQPPTPNRGEGDDYEPAPVGSGLVILLSLGAAYGAKKVYDARRRINN